MLLAVHQLIQFNRRYDTPFGTKVLEVFYGTLQWFQDYGHDVISRNKVLPLCQWTRSVCQCLCGSVRQFLVSSTFVLAYL